MIVAWFVLSKHSYIYSTIRLWRILSEPNALVSVCNALNEWAFFYRYITNFLLFDCNFVPTVNSDILQHLYVAVLSCVELFWVLRFNANNFCWFIKIASNSINFASILAASHSITMTTGNAYWPLKQSDDSTYWLSDRPGSALAFNDLSWVTTTYAHIHKHSSTPTVAIFNWFLFSYCVALNWF